MDKSNPKKMESVQPTLKLAYEKINNFSLIEKLAAEMCSKEWYDSYAHRRNIDKPLPSVAELTEVISLFRQIFFPGYFGPSEVKRDNMSFYMGVALDEAYRKLAEQINRGYCFACTEAANKDCSKCKEEALRITEKLFNELPRIRRILATDVQAAFEGDPAAKQPGETIFCYPSLRAISNHRIAHELYRLDAPLIPRIISEIAHSETGIDIHPGAQIDEKFFMDHGTGIVIGETCIIGKNVRVYQGVTLGAKSFPMDENGNPIKGISRHPIIEDDVVIYSGATILGRITVGRGSVIGGNVWLTRSVEPHNDVMQSIPK